MAAASVDLFSRGRLILGLGSSHKVQVEGEHGLPYSRPLTRIRESVAIIRDVLKNGSTSHKGDVFQIRRFDLRFEPVRREIPIYLGAVFPTMMQVCGEIAEGTILTSPTLENARTAADNVAIGARRARRDPATVEVTALLRCSIAADIEEAREPIRHLLAARIGTYPRYMRMMAEDGFASDVAAVKQAWESADRQRAARLVPDVLVDSRALVGTAEDCRRRIEEYRAAGVTLPIVSPVRGDGAGEVLRALTPSS